jgi:hypothetical protein
MHRQRVDEFVGDDEQRPVRHLCEVAVPLDRHTGATECLFLLLAQDRADLDEMNRDRAPERRHGARGP